MHPVIRNIIAVIGGIIIGGIINMSLIYLGPVIISLPEGADVTTKEGLEMAMPLLQPQHYIFPFLAHALGTLSGSIFAGMVAATNRDRNAWIVGLFFLMGGVANVTMLPSPTWFNVLDLGLAYIPMAYFGGKIGQHINIK